MNCWTAAIGTRRDPPILTEIKRCERIRSYTLDLPTLSTCATSSGVSKSGLNSSSALKANPPSTSAVGVAAAAAG